MTAAWEQLLRCFPGRSRAQPGFAGAEGFTMYYSPGGRSSPWGRRGAKNTQLRVGALEARQEAG